MNLADAIEHLRAMHAHDALNAQALAVCLEVLAEHAHDGGALLREVNPKAYSTLKSAPPLTPEERAHAASYKGPPLKCSCGKPSLCVSQDSKWDTFECDCGVGAKRAKQPSP